MSGIQWGSATWGQVGHNVHESSDGSWVADSHFDGPVDQ